MERNNIVQGWVASGTRGTKKRRKKTDSFSKNRQAAATATTANMFSRQTPLRRRFRRQSVIKIHYDIIK